MNLYAAGAIAAVLFGSGMSAAIFTPGIGAMAQLSRKDDKITDITANLKVMQEAVQARDKAIAERDATLAANAAQEAADASQITTFWKGQSRAAFQAGRASCPGSPAGGVSDLRSLQESGRFVPGSAGLPGKPEISH